MQNHSLTLVGQPNFTNRKNECHLEILIMASFKLPAPTAPVVGEHSR